MNNAKRVLLMHISNVSGHRCASLAIEKALRQIDAKVQTCNIDAFNYTNPYLEKFINKLYMFVIVVMPGLWDYLYDNEGILKRVKKIRSLFHKVNEKKIQKLFDEFKPDIVVCTQAFPCGMVADYKRRHNLSTPLMGVLTDYAPHLYWLSNFVDIYVVPAPGVQQKLRQRGVPGERLKVLGIPIDTKFRNINSRQEIFRRLGLDSNLPVILIMGGGQGLGPIKEIVRTLDKLRSCVQMIVVCGTNKSLYKWLKKKKSIFNKPVSIIGYSDQINDLMTISSFMVSKPGGLTSAEALSKSLPIIIVKPLPGQENRNTRFLLETGIALKVNNFSQLQSLAEELLNDTAKLDNLRKRVGAFAQSDSSLKIARFILDIIEQRKID